MPGEEEVNMEDQEKLLSEALLVVKAESFKMKRSLDGAKLMDGLKHASTMLCELRTSLLSPKSYYELYMAIADELRHLETFLVDEFQKEHKVSDLYELVQYAGNIIPRLYLLVTVGAVYIKVKQVPTKDILKDLVEMCRGVQHPLRGLFLRNYLLSSIKRELPETETDDKHGNVHDSIDFILLNFSEMNKLWVRMQHQGHSRDKTRREKERRELRILVGTNLVRLSSLEGVNLHIYQEKILPAVLEQIISCKDPIAQEYLMECIIQVFPDEFHLATLAPFLDCCGKLHAQVAVKNIISALIDRLATFALRDGGSIPSEIKLFDIFTAQVAEVIKARPDMATDDIVLLQVSLANLALKCYPTQYQFVDQVLEYTATMLKTREVDNLDGSNAVAKSLSKLVKIPVDDYPSFCTVLGLSHFGSLLPFFGAPLRKELAVYILRSVVDRETSLSDSEQVSRFLDIIGPLLKPAPAGPDAAAAAASDAEEVAEEQGLVGRFIALLQGSTPDTQYQLLVLVRKTVGAAGESRIKFTLPPLVFQAFKLARVYFNAKEQDDIWEKKLQKIFQFCHQTITVLAKAEFVELALRLFLQSALAVNSTPFDKSESVAYEFMSQAFLLYEEEISDSKAQISAIELLVGTLESLSCFGEDNYTPLGTKCALVSSKLVKKPDQARGVCLCCHLFWSGKTTESQGEEKQDGKQVLQCLQRALKVANTCMEPATQVQLFVEIFNRYLLFYEKGASQVAMAHINKICSLIKENLEKLEPGVETETIALHFKNTLAHIKRKKLAADPQASYSDFEG